MSRLCHIHNFSSNQPSKQKCISFQDQLLPLQDHVFLKPFLDTNNVPPRGFTTCSKNCMPFLWQKVWKNNSISRNPNEEHSRFEFRLFIGRMRHNSAVQYRIKSENKVSTWICQCLHLESIYPTIRVAMLLVINM